MKRFLYSLLSLIFSVHVFGGYVVEFRFGDENRVRPITSTVKISEFIGIGENPEDAKVVNSSHKVGDAISPGEIFTITIDDSKNKNLIPSNLFDAFVNEELNLDILKNYFKGIIFEIENTKFPLIWTQISPKTLRLLGGAGSFSWGCFERSGYPIKDRKSGIFHHLIDCGFYSKQ